MRLLRGGNRMLLLQQQARRVLLQHSNSTSSYSCYYRCFTSTRSASLEAPSSSSTSKPKGTPYSALTIGIPKEGFPLEKRVAASPESVARLLKPGFAAVNVETGAGEASYFSDAAYQEAGATIVQDAWKSDIVLKVSVLKLLGV